MQQNEKSGTCAFLRRPPVLPPKMGAGVLGSRLGGDQGFFSSFFSSFFSFVAPSAETATLHHKNERVRITVTKALIDQVTQNNRSVGLWSLKKKARIEILTAH